MAAEPFQYSGGLQKCLSLTWRIFQLLKVLAAKMGPQLHNCRF